MADTTLTPDLCVIGGNLGGAALAMGAAAAGVPVVLLHGAEGGGEARARAALTLPAMAAVARQLHAVGAAGRFGIKAAEPEIEFGLVSKRVEELIVDLARNHSDARLAALGVRVIPAAPRFIDPRAVAVNDLEIRARRFVLALPSAPRIPDIRGLARTPYLTVERLLDLRELPGHLIVVGARATGLACAQVFRRLGAAVTVLEGAAALAGEDREPAGILLDTLAREGIRIREGARAARVDKKNGVIRVTIATDGGDEVVEGTHLLLAVGRTTDANGLGLEMAGVEYDDDGLRVGPDLRTANTRVFAVPDEPGAVHLMRAHARAILRNLLFRLPLRPAALVLPRTTQTDPALAHVGLTEAEARARHGNVRILRAPFAENDRAALERDTAGTIKIVTTPASKLLGVTILGRDAGEQIALYALALAKGMNLRSLADLHVPHPARAELGQAAILPALSRDLTTTWVRRIIALLRQFG